MKIRSINILTEVLTEMINERLGPRTIVPASATHKPKNEN